MGISFNLLAMPKRDIRLRRFLLFFPLLPPHKEKPKRAVGHQTNGSARLAGFAWVLGAFTRYCGASCEGPGDPTGVISSLGDPGTRRRRPRQPRRWPSRRCWSARRSNWTCPCSRRYRLANSKSPRLTLR